MSRYRSIDDKHDISFAVVNDHDEVIAITADETLANKISEMAIDCRVLSESKGEFYFDITVDTYASFDVRV